MITLYITQNVDLYDKVKKIYLEKFGISDVKIERTANGKPFATADGNNLQVQFSVAHTQNFAVLAFGKTDVGVDCEKIAPRKKESVLRSFSQREREEINCDTDFFKNWTAKEAFVKFNGFTLANQLKNLQYVDDTLLFNGIAVNNNIIHLSVGEHLICVCANECDTEVIYL